MEGFWQSLKLGWKTKAATATVTIATMNLGQQIFF